MLEAEHGRFRILAIFRKQTKRGASCRASLDGIARLVGATELVENLFAAREKRVGIDPLPCRNRQGE